MTCKRLQSRSYSYPEKSNLPGYRVNRTVSFQVCDVDYLGLVFAKGIYHSSNDETHKGYIVLFTGSTSRGVYLIWLKTMLVKTLLIVLKDL